MCGEIPKAAPQHGSKLISNEVTKAVLVCSVPYGISDSSSESLTQWPKDRTKETVDQSFNGRYHCSLHLALSVVDDTVDGFIDKRGTGV
mmetsp:Transcript_43224/g.101676  ORF Transcript_43224/g.101676 Transcript_43224/m.101676 type:complete len:89 (+) Transcript_43224:1364-1630(+)